MANGNGSGTGDGGHETESAFSIVNSLSLLIVGAYIAAMPMWMWWPPEVKPEVLAIINQMMGAWGIAFGTVLAYHLGSSRTAKDANASNRDALSTMTGAAATTANTAAAVAGQAGGAGTAMPVPTGTADDPQHVKVDGVVDLAAAPAAPKPAPAPTIPVGKPVAEVVLPKSNAPPKS